MQSKIFKVSAMVLVICLLTGCLTACPSRIHSEDRKSIEELEIEIEGLKSEIEGLDIEIEGLDSEIEDLKDEIESLNSQLESLATTESAKTRLTIWTFTTETQTMATAFKETHPDVTINLVYISLDNNMIRDEAIEAAYAEDCPDVLVLDSSFAKGFVDSDMLLDISDLKTYAEELQTYSNTLELGTNFDTGEIRAYAYQNSIGAVFYRRSLAKEYFGTDDPSSIQAMMSDMTKFSDMAKTVSEKSGGKTYMISSNQELVRPVLNNRKQPWFVDNTLVIDPIAEEYIDIAKNYRDNGYDAGAGQWTGEWYAGMNDTLTNANGEPLNIFCYFLPTWGLQYVLVPNCTETAGDWACCAGPLPYQWGGTWLGVMKNTARPDISKEFIRFCTMDADNLTNWATGVYTNEYLTAISPELVNAGSTPVLMPAGDFISSQIVADAITSQFDSSSLSSFLGGQNPYAVFSAAAQNCRADAVRKYDDEAQMYLTRSIESYLSGLLTKKGALKTFKEDMLYVLQDINT